MAPLKLCSYCGHICTMRLCHKPWVILPTLALEDKVTPNKTKDKKTWSSHLPCATIHISCHTSGTVTFVNSENSDTRSDDTTRVAKMKPSTHQKINNGRVILGVLRNRAEQKFLIVIPGLCAGTDYFALHHTPHRKERRTNFWEQNVWMSIEVVKHTIDQHKIPGLS